MKKILLFALCMLFVMLFSFFAFADDGAADMPEGTVWIAKSADGTVSYSDSFYGGLTAAKNGDSLTLVPNYIELDGIFNLNTGATITVDFGDSTIVYPDNTYTAPVFQIGNKTNLTIYSSGAAVYLQNNVRSFISISSGSLTVLGDGFSVYAPDAVDASGDAVVELHNVYFYKSSSNMMGLLCARASSVVTAYDSTLISGVTNGNAAYSCVDGKMSLYNTTVISLDGTNAVQVSDRATLYARDTVFSCTTKGNAVTVDAGCALLVNGGYTLADGVAVSGLKPNATFTVDEFVAPSSTREKTVTSQLAIYISPSAGKPTDNSTENSVWMIENGDTVCFTDDFYYPLVYSQDGDKLTLLKDVTVTQYLKTQVKAKSIDLSSFNLTVDLPDYADWTGLVLLNHVGGTELDIAAAGNITLDLGLVAASRPTHLAFGGVLNMPSVATVSGADLTVTGGVINTTGTAFTTVGDGDITLTSVELFAGGRISSGADAFLTDTTAAISDGKMLITALGTVTVRGESYLVGNITATSMTAEKGVYFDTPPTVSTDFLTKPMAEPHAHPKYPDLIFNYTASTLDGEIYASLDMSNDVVLRVYLPTYVYNLTNVFTLISVDGIVYTPAATSGKSATIAGENYTRFTYSQIHASDINEELCVRVSVAGDEYECRITLRDLFVKSINESDSDSFKKLAATYLSYAFETVNYTPDDDTLALISQYAVNTEVPVPTAPDFIRTVYFDTEREIVRIYATDGVDIFAIRTNWDGKSMYLRFDDGSVELPYLRLNPSSTFTVYYTADGKTSTAELGILSLYAVISDSAGHSANLFETYLSYLILYKSLV